MWPRCSGESLATIESVFRVMTDQLSANAGRHACMPHLQGWVKAHRLHAAGRCHSAAQACGQVLPTRQQQLHRVGGCTTQKQIFYIDR